LDDTLVAAGIFLFHFFGQKNRPTLTTLKDGLIYLTLAFLGYNFTLKDIISREGRGKLKILLEQEHVIILIY